MGRKGKAVVGEEVESFFGVYLLLSSNPLCKGRTYIGFTVDPNRRIQQHNLGKSKGGARRTHNKGPWDMVLIVHGFPNEISALRFEWAWQNPQRSRRLRHISPKKTKEAAYDFALRVLSEMLRVGPWCRLPLLIRWLVPNQAKEFPAGCIPPVHMPICYGPVVSKKISSKAKRKENDNVEIMEEFSILICCLCRSLCSKDEVLNCLVKDCRLEAHIICLAKHFLGAENTHVLPVEGSCPKCETSLLWGDLIRKKKGCYSALGQEKDGCSLSDFETEKA